MEVLPDLSALSHAELRELISDLEAQENEIAYTRRPLHGKLDILHSELVARLKTKGEGKLNGEGAGLRSTCVFGSSPRPAWPLVLILGAGGLVAGVGVYDLQPAHGKLTVDAEPRIRKLPEISFSAPGVAANDSTRAAARRGERSSAASYETRVREVAVT
jgi:hypothetical protein